MPKTITTWTIYLVLAVALLGQTVGASYSVAQMCDSLTTESMAMPDGVTAPHYMDTESTNLCCEESNSHNNTSCEMHSCVFVGLQSSELKHSVTFNASRYIAGPQYTHFLITLDNLYRPPIILISL